MIRQHRGVQHVGIREHEIGLGLDPPPLGGGRVAVVHARANRFARRAAGEQFEQIA